MHKLAALLLALAPLHAADRVILKNGDVLTGNIVKKDGDKLTIKSEFLGDVSMPWTAVRSIRTDEPVTVELPNNERVAGKLVTTGEEFQITTTPTTRNVPLAQVGAIRNPDEQRTWERL